VTWEVSSNYWALVADVGPYTGPWPPNAPWLFPADAGEIDFWVGLPNPDGVAADFLDWSYPSLYRYAYRYRSGGSTRTVGHFGSVDGATGPDAMPTGSHLLVVWYDVDFSDPSSMPTPSVEPLALVPSGYASGGTGPDQPSTGAWSEWQDTVDVGLPWSWDDSVSRKFIYSEETSDTAAATADAQAHLLAGDGTRYTGTAGIVHAGFDISYMNSAPGPRRAEVVLGQWVGNLNVDLASPSLLDYNPPLLAGMTKGVDYDTRPGHYDNDLDAYLEYEPGGCTFLNWDDWTVPLSMQEFAHDHTGANTAWGDHHGTVFRVAKLAGLATTNTPPPYIGQSYWPAWGDGTELARFSRALPYAVAGGTSTVNVTIPLSSVLDTSFHLAIQPDHLAPLGGSEQNPLVSYGWTSGFLPDARISMKFPPLFGTGSTPGPTLHYRRPRWRYWALPTGAYELETIGEHFRSVRGDEIRLRSADLWEPILPTT